MQQQMSKLKTDSLKELFKENNVIFAYLFWSKARNEENEYSDTDIAIYLDKTKDTQQRSIYWDDVYFMTKVWELLETDKVDIVILNNLEAESLKYNILVDWILIYEDDTWQRAFIENKMIMQAKDYMEKHYWKYLK